jgi:hypothetical protein
MNDILVRHFYIFFPFVVPSYEAHLYLSQNFPRPSVDALMHFVVVSILTFSSHYNNGGPHYRRTQRN